LVSEKQKLLLLLTRARSARSQAAQRPTSQAAKPPTLQRAQRATSPLRLQVGLRRFGEREVERGALAFDARGADGAAVALDDALDRGQADAVAGELFLRVQALERTEQLVGVGGREACAVVAHEELVAVAPDLDPRLRAVAGDLPGIGQ